MERVRPKRPYSSSSNSSSSSTYSHYYDRPKRPYGSGGGGGHHNRHRHSTYQPLTVDTNQPINTCFRILCPEVKTAGVIGKGGSIIKSLRQETGAWINVQQLVPGDDERVIEITDVRSREPDGSISPYSPAQEALRMIHDRILNWDDDLAAPSAGGPPGGNRIATRLVVPRSHVGCLLGKGGKIIEQMRQETNSHIRILPRDHHLPRCVSQSDELVQVVGDATAVKKALENISSRLKENPLRDRGAFHGKLHSSDPQAFPDDDLGPYINSGSARGHFDGSGTRNSGYALRPSGYGKYDSDANHIADNMEPFSSEEIVFQILCPCDRVDRIVDEDRGILALLRDEVGVNVKVADAVPGSHEQTIIITSDEDQDDILFPAQEALLHIQTHLVDLAHDKENIVKTRLLVPSIEIDYLGERDLFLTEISRSSNAEMHVLPREQHPLCTSSSDELVEIVGEIRAARQALLQLTDRLRGYFFAENSLSRESLSIPVDSSIGNVGTVEPIPSIRNTLPKGCEEDGPPLVSVQSLQPGAVPRPTKDVLLTSLTEGDGSRALSVEESSARDGVPNVPERFPAAIVTKTTVEVAISEHATAALTRSKNKLMQISEISGAKVELVENMIKISGSPEQAEKAQNLLQGFILSIELDDAPNGP
ncbi:Flowering locus K-like proteiny domain [Nymphaea thermarum]|nr:Flowering locus K-like proteiny domain [Nymphaea thermarum]